MSQILNDGKAHYRMIAAQDPWFWVMPLERVGGGQGPMTFHKTKLRKGILPKPPKMDGA